MRFEVFHAGLLGRPNILAVDMIQYPGLWGVCISHHTPNNNHPRYAADTSTAGTLRFIEAARDGRDGLDLQALADYVITTHHVDADAVLPVWALLHPDSALARRSLLESVARSGDFFLFLDKTSAKINAAIEAVHLRLRGSGRAGERLVDTALTKACFDWLLPRMEGLLDDPDQYREFWHEPLNTLYGDVAYLEQPGRVKECWEQHLSLVEADHDPDTHALNTVCGNDLLLVWRTDSPRRLLDVRPAIAWYELTSIPLQPRYNLADLAQRLNTAERASGDVPVWTYQAGPVNLAAELSGLGQNEVLAIVQEWLDNHSEEQIPAAYRAGMAEANRRQQRHPIFDSYRRFAETPQVSFRLDAPYEGLHFLGARESQPDSGRLMRAGRRQSLPFAVADAFYWNNPAPSPLELEVVYLDCGTGTLRVQYDAWSDPMCSTPGVALAGDGAVKSARFTLPDARMGASQDQGADLRLTHTAGAPFALQELILRKL